MNNKLASIIIGFIALAIIWYAVGWMVALGLFLHEWSHNLEKHQ